ncbi:MAG: CoB--CoM heterodisulfide reductase iron-sulfur subunit B family protein [Candidatus Bathyarchaeota archaeon]|jgi:heterodisulfide reductase subunit B
MRYSVFLGCTIPSRQMNYELSAREVSKKLGIELLASDYGCCGFPLEPVDEIKALSMAAMNLKKAHDTGLSLVSLCSACGEMLVKAQSLLDEDEASLKAVNRLLKKSLDSNYKDEKVRVVHFARMLYQDVGVEKIRESVTNPLEGLKVATHPGCHYVRPSTLFDGFDDPEFPGTLDRLVEATGAESVDYEGKIDCCGGGILAVNEGVAKLMTLKKLETLSKAGVDALVLICPFCGIMYDRYQKLMAMELEREFGIPVLYYPQLLGLAQGIDPEKLGFDMNSIPVDGLLERVGA